MNERLIIRGGSWYDEPGVLRSANRNWDTTGNRNNDLSFRLVLRNPQRMIRGGAWYLNPRFARSAFRDWDAPENRYNALGFRLALKTRVPLEDLK